MGLGPGDFINEYYIYKKKSAQDENQSPVIPLNLHDFTVDP